MSISKTHKCYSCGKEVEEESVCSEECRTRMVRDLEHTLSYGSPDNAERAFEMLRKVESLPIGKVKTSYRKAVIGSTIAGSISLALLLFFGSGIGLTMVVTATVIFAVYNFMKGE